VAKEDEELFGTWINPDYDEKLQAAKFIYEPDGVLRGYNDITVIGFITAKNCLTNSASALHPDCASLLK
jgi:hypothetical protein